MFETPGLLLVAAVAAVGVLHTIVPDHWVPITFIARQRGWSRAETARAALQAGIGHVGTTLILGLAVWVAGVAFATTFGHIVDTVASIALVGFGCWIAFAGLRDMRKGGHGHSHGNGHGHGHGHSATGALDGQGHHGHDHSSEGGVHGPELQTIDTGHGIAMLSIFDDGVPPRFRFTGPATDWVRAETIRDDGASQEFTFANRGSYWESLEEIPEPHGFEVTLTLGHGTHDHRHVARFVEHVHGHDGHDHDQAHAPEDDPLFAPMRGGVAVLLRHVHLHRHGGTLHAHWHEHDADTRHDVTAQIEADPPLHTHKHKTTARTALLLILGSSPMVEGIPAFFAAARYGIALIVLMALVFAFSTIATYVLLCVISTAGLQRVRLGEVERYGEVLSGAFIALVGVAFWLWPVM
jgi:ABC-type nickel/cobalt efflux system permease component RcnA